MQIPVFVLDMNGKAWIKVIQTPNNLEVLKQYFSVL